MRCKCVIRHTLMNIRLLFFDLFVRDVFFFVETDIYYCLNIWSNKLIRVHAHSSIVRVHVYVHLVKPFFVVSLVHTLSHTQRRNRSYFIRDKPCAPHTHRTSSNFQLNIALNDNTSYPFEWIYYTHSSERQISSYFRK